MNKIARLQQIMREEAEQFLKREGAEEGTKSYEDFVRSAVESTSPDDWDDNEDRVRLLYREWLESSVSDDFYEIKTHPSHKRWYALYCNGVIIDTAYYSDEKRLSEWDKIVDEEAGAKLYGKEGWI